MGDQAQLRGLVGAGGVRSGLQKLPSSSSRHRGGSAEPGTVCELLRGLGARVGSAARVSVSTRTEFSWLGYPNTTSHPMHFLKTT